MQHVFNSSRLEELHHHLKMVQDGRPIVRANKMLNQTYPPIFDKYPYNVGINCSHYEETKAETLNRIIKELDLLIKQFPEMLVRFHSRKYAEAYARMKVGETVWLNNFTFSMLASGDITRHSAYMEKGTKFYPEEKGYIFGPEEIFSEDWKFNL